jgi:DNA-binding GntR family transcriptional regulator
MDTKRWELGFSRSQTIYAMLKDMIRSGELPPGQRLREIEIAKAQGVSRTPVREAVHRLVSEGLLEMNAASGVAVTEFSKQQVLELYDLREFLEGASARSAAQHASPAEIRALRDQADFSRTIAETDFTRHAKLNQEFHARIADAAHNEYLNRALAQLSDFLMLVPGTAIEYPGRAPEVHPEHTAILDAIDARDADAAESAARLHIRNTGKVRLQVLFGRH